LGGRRTLVFVVAWGCGGAPAAGVADATSTTEPAGSSESSSADDSSSAASRLDLANADEELGCRKIDFLFVIDDSTSMADEQQRLIDGFPGFIAGVRDTILDFDHHVMVITTGIGAPSYDPCENMLGTGRVRDSAGNDCGLLDDYLHGQRYIDSENDDLEGAFACIADVGSHGDGDEKTIWALADAITDEAGAGHCNDGFRRDDAILVVTIISDEEDSPDDGPPLGDNDDNSPGGPSSWKTGLVASSDVDEAAVVVLALVGDSDLDDGLCEPYELGGVGAEPAPRLRALAESFPYGSWASVCQDDYAQFFNEAVADIGSACADFMPPG
jgi:hypothetical protein